MRDRILKLFWFDYAISTYTSQYNFNKYNFKQFIMYTEL